MLVNTLTDKTMKIAQYGTTIVRWFCGLTDPAGDADYAHPRVLPPRPERYHLPYRLGNSLTDELFINID
jgi:hypothetical protein